MTANREPNPLRPYYVPPSLGDRTTPATSSAHAGGKHGSSSSASASSFGSSARTILADIDYSEMLSDPSPSSTATIKGLADQALWKYTSVFLAQPFEIAKTVLQVRLQSIASQSSTSATSADEARRKRTQQRRDDAHKMYNVCELHLKKQLLWLTLAAALFLRLRIRLTFILHGNRAPQTNTFTATSSSTEACLSWPALTLPLSSYRPSANPSYSRPTIILLLDRCSLRTLEN